MSSGQSPATLIEALERAADSDHGVELLDRRERSTKVSWRRILDRSRRLAAGLEAAGVEAGDRVGLIYPTGPDFFHALFGILWAGAVPVPLYPPVRLGGVGSYRSRTGALLTRVGTRLVLAGEATVRLFREAVGEAPSPIDCRSMDELAELTANAERSASVARSADDIALVQFSSGTTSDPKPVALSHRALLEQVRRLNDLWPAGRGIRHAGVSWLPLYHDMGLVGCVFVALSRPGPLTLLPPELFVARPASWLRAVSRCRATISPAPTFAYQRCVERVRDEELEGVDLSSWDFALCGAETVVPAVLRRFAERFAPWGFRREALTPVYGMAEAALAVTFSEPGGGLRSRVFGRRPLRQGRAVEEEGGLEIASVGPPLPGFELQIRDGEGEPRPEREVGRVWVRGPSLMAGYLDDEIRSESCLVDGWLDTGDRGFLLDGELYLTGRAKELLIVGGRNHAPEELEGVAGEVPGATPGAVAAVARPRREAAGEDVLLFVERRRGSTVPVRELVESCRRKILAVVGIAVDQVVVLEAGGLPRTSSGKVRRREALERHLRGELRQLAPEASAEGAGGR